jgi:hypothetical protein
MFHRNDRIDRIATRAFALWIAVVGACRGVTSWRLVKRGAAAARCACSRRKAFGRATWATTASQESRGGQCTDQTANGDRDVAELNHQSSIRRIRKVVQWKWHNGYDHRAGTIILNTEKHAQVRLRSHDRFNMVGQFAGRSVALALPTQSHSRA